MVNSSPYDTFQSFCCTQGKEAQGGKHVCPKSESEQDSLYECSCPRLMHISSSDSGNIPRDIFFWCQGSCLPNPQGIRVDLAVRVFFGGGGRGWCRFAHMSLLAAPRSAIPEGQKMALVGGGLYVALTPSLGGSSHPQPGHFSWVLEPGSRGSW